MSQRNAQYQLSSIIEMDDTYMGCTSHNSRCGREKDISKIMMAQSESYIGSCSVHLNKGCKRYQMQDATAAHPNTDITIAEFLDGWDGIDIK